MEHLTSTQSETIKILNILVIYCSQNKPSLKLNQLQNYHLAQSVEINTNLMQVFHLTSVYLKLKFLKFANNINKIFK